MSLVWTMTLGGSQPELLKHLLDELGVDDDEPRGGLKAAF
jgi:hypothetical protein